MHSQNASILQGRGLIQKAIKLVKRIQAQAQGSQRARSRFYHFILTRGNTELLKEICNQREVEQEKKIQLCQLQCGVLKARRSRSRRETAEFCNIKRSPLNTQTQRQVSDLNASTSLSLAPSSSTCETPQPAPEMLCFYVDTGLKQHWQFLSTKGSQRGKYTYF